MLLMLLLQLGKMRKKKLALHYTACVNNILASISKGKYEAQCHPILNVEDHKKLTSLGYTVTWGNISWPRS